MIGRKDDDFDTNNNDMKNLYYVADIKPQTSWFGFVHKTLPSNLTSFSKDQLSGNQIKITNLDKAVVFAMLDAYLAGRAYGTLKKCNLTPMKHFS